jgi:hypothetical protein
VSSKGSPWCPASAGLPAFLLYLGLSLVLTWPLIAGVTSDVPGDLGDSLLNMWILAWGAEHLPQLLTGAMSWSEFWNANTFHPEPLSFALSEHLLGQTLQILPVYWLSGNIILCYNLLFISTFALSALGAYLLVRDLTGDTRAAFIAGLIYGFLPYRIASVPHLQVMSSQWMPLALWGFNRFICRSPVEGSRFPALIFATAALVLQNWSCVYYLLYFVPFLMLFVLHRMLMERRLRDLNTWAGLIAAAAITLALTVPFLLPYQAVHDRFGIERPVAEVERYSANVWSYVTASENLRLWGTRLRFHPFAEGETFLGFTPWLLACVAIGGLLLARTEATAAPSLNRDDGTDHPAWRRAVVWVLAILAISQFVALMSTVMFGGFNINVFGMPIRARTAPRLLLQFLAPLAALLALSPRPRQQAARLLRSPVMFALFAVLLAIWLSLGPTPSAGAAHISGFGLYGVLQDFVPGYNGLRVPARFAMLAGLFLAILAGYGIKFLTLNTALLTTVSVLVVLEGFAVPLEINRTWRQYEAMPPARVYPRAAAPLVYQRVAALPEGAVITEFPFGDGAWEIRYTFYSAAHWKPITNGYSGAFPPSYRERMAYLQRAPANPDGSWRILRDTGTTHVIVHRNAFAKSEDADTLEAWLKSHGARQIERFEDGDILWSLPPDS